MYSNVPAHPRSSLHLYQLAVDRYMPKHSALNRSRRFSPCSYMARKQYSGFILSGRGIGNLMKNVINFGRLRAHFIRLAQRGMAE